jgi:hypothetical protein
MKWRCNVEKPAVVNQGRIIVEFHSDDGFLIMWPDGQIELAASKDLAEARIKRWAKKTLGNGWKIGLTTIEWRL